MSTIKIKLIITFILLVLTNYALATQIKRSVFPEPYNIRSWHCLKNSPVTCFAVGSENAGAVEMPVLLKSTDGGATWKSQLSTNTPTKGYLTAISCAWDGSICTALGLTDQNDDFIIQSADMSTWKLATLPEPPQYFKFVKLKLIDCTGTGAGSLCVLGGGSFMDGGYLLQTRNRGVSWELAVLEIHLYFTDLLSISCAGDNNTARCIAYMKVMQRWDEIVINHYTYDGGKTWGGERP